MQFCPLCNSYMKPTKDGLLCRKCDHLIQITIAPKLNNKSTNTKIVFIESDFNNLNSKERVLCPNCGNDEAFYSVHGVSGEHAGVKTERIIKHFKCVKCSNLWSQGS